MRTIKVEKYIEIISLLLLSAPISSQGDLDLPRVISLVPSVTEIIYAIDGEEALVGVVDPEGYPTNVDKVIVGRYSSPNFEMIYSLDPEVVFIEGGEQERFRSPLESLQMRVVTINPEDIEGIFYAVLEIGKLLNRENEASLLVDSLKRELDEIRGLQRPKKDRKTVFIEISQNPLITVGMGSFINGLMEEAGVINITSDIESPYPVISQELVINRNPDFIILAHKDGTHPEARIGWSEVEAVEDGNIVEDIDLDLLLRPGPRSIGGIRALISAVYGDL